MISFTPTPCGPAAGISSSSPSGVVACIRSGTGGIAGGERGLEGVDRRRHRQPAAKLRRVDQPHLQLARDRPPASTGWRAGWRRCRRARPRRSGSRTRGRRSTGPCSRSARRRRSCVPSPRIRSMMPNTWSTRIGARPMEGSSISSTFGLAISARPIATICCSPPDSVPAFCLRRSRTRGNVSSTRSRSSLDRGAIGALVRPQLEVLRHRHVAEQPPVLRHHRDAPANDLRRRQTADRLAAEQDLPLARRHEAEDRLQRRGLAAGVAAQQAHHLARVDLDVHVAQHRDEAVVRAHVPHLEDRLALPPSPSLIPMPSCPGRPRSRARRSRPRRRCPRRSSARSRTR